MMRVLGISGSLRHDSFNTKLLRAAGELLPPPAELEVFEGLKDVPPYDQDDDGDRTPAAARRLRKAIEEADAILIATPEYNSSIPGQLKNALDWASRPVNQGAFRGKPVAVIGASTGMFGAVWAQAETRKVLGAIGARVMDLELPVAKADQAFNEDGRLADPELREQLEEILAELASLAEQARAPQQVAA
jgi:chromate reductase